MESYIPISFLNDFIFCPRSIYFHQLYGNYDASLYNDTPQVEGKLAHDIIDSKKYSSKKSVLQGIDVFCEEYNLCGKIDLLYLDTGELVERKNKIKTIYDGYVFQLYAQYFSLIEMGYIVKSMAFHSLKDNKKYPVVLPHEDESMLVKFKSTIKQLQEFNLEDEFIAYANKCKYCIYSNLCDKEVVND